MIPNIQSHQSILSPASSYSYNDYKALVSKFAEEGSTSGEANEERIAATHINAQRMKRIDKQCELLPELQVELDKAGEKYTWVVITESWCGDSAQNVPVLAKMAEYQTGIKFSLIFRDENPEIIDAHLTNGGRAIPKLICINTLTKELVGTWGPRPKAIQEMVVDYKKNNSDASHDEFVKNLHLWYAKDKTNSMQKEFVELLKEWNAH